MEEDAETLFFLQPCVSKGLRNILTFNPVQMRCAHILIRTRQGHIKTPRKTYILAVYVNYVLQVPLRPWHLLLLPSPLTLKQNPTNHSLRSLAVFWLRRPVPLLVLILLLSSISATGHLTWTASVEMEISKSTPLPA